MKIYWKKCKKHTENIFKKKMVSISKNTIKEESNVLFENRIENVIEKKGDKLYVKWKGYDNSLNSWINKRDLA